MNWLPDDIKVTWYNDAKSCLEAVGTSEVIWLDFGVVEVTLILSQARQLRWISTPATGLDSWPLESIRQHGLLLTNGAGIAAIPISEYVVMGLLAGMKGMPQLMRAQEQRTWLSHPPSLGELFGRRAVVYGYGSIGRAIADRMRAFGVEVTGVRRHPQGESGVVGVDRWESHLAHSDILVLSVPLTPTTRGLIGHQQLTALPRGAWLANIARGNLVDENALVRALQSGQLGGALLDVTSIEPLPEDSELWTLPNVIVTPHISWASSRMTERAIALFRRNLQHYASGEPMDNVVSFQDGY